MKPKMIVTAALLLFVVVSLAAVVVKEVRGGGAEVTAPVSVSEGGAIGEAAEKAHYVVYYFHGNMRCRTCNVIESQSRNAITTMFATQLESGDMAWKEVNIDMAENAHFRDDFQLAFQSVVLTEERSGKTVRWENLTDVWRKVHGSPLEFEEYVVQSTIEFMAGGAI
ncbi:MAG: hypothetical protein JJU11_06425 [Candidatus Sumerlaeia bacterium]|nr:hypothetical protein [Candidatus Sumerlaeia bacterium]